MPFLALALVAKFVPQAQNTGLVHYFVHPQMIILLKPKLASDQVMIQGDVLSLTLSQSQGTFTLNVVSLL